MKEFVRTAVIATVLLVLPCTAFADADVYFRVAGDAGSNSVGHILEVNVAKPVDSIFIEMVVDVDDDGLHAVSTSLINTGAGGIRLRSLVSYPPPGPFTMTVGASVINYGNILAANFGAVTLGPPGYVGTGVVLSTFRLDYDLSEGNTVEIAAEIGNSYWLASSFTGTQVQFADGGYVNGGMIGAGGNTVITIVPEPATLSILILGSAALIRRRR